MIIVIKEVSGNVLSILYPLYMYTLAGEIMALEQGRDGAWIRLDSEAFRIT